MNDSHAHTEGGGYFGCSNTPLWKMGIRGVETPPPPLLLIWKIYEDIPTPCLENWPSDFDKGKKGVGVPPFFRAGAVSRPGCNAKTPPLNNPGYAYDLKS